MIEDQMNQRLEEDSINFGKIFRSILMQSKLIIILTIITTAIVVTSYFSSEKTYKVTSLIKIDGSGLQATGVEYDFLSSSNSSNLDNSIQLYKTRTNLLETINYLNLNVSLKTSKNEGKLHVKHFKINDNSIELSEKTILEVNDESYFLTTNQNGGEKKALLYDQKYIFDSFSIQLNKIGVIENEEIELVFINPDMLVNVYKGIIMVESLSSVRFLNAREGLINVSMITNDVEKGKSILQKLNEIFVREDLSYNSKKAKSAVSFIDERIKTIGTDLALKQSKLRDYQEETSTLNIDLEVQTIIQKISQLQKILDEIQIEKSRIRERYTVENPLYLNLLEQEKVLLNQISSIENDIVKLPNAQQNYLNLFRDYDATQIIYNELLNQKLSFSILEASTIGSIRIIDEPYLTSKVSPNPISYLFYMLALFVFNIFVGFIRGIFFTPITNPAELRESGIFEDIYGVMPDLDSDERYSRSLETLCLNIDNSIGTHVEKGKIVCITSPLASCGKTTTSLSYSRKLAELGFKTLLLDFDFKKGDIHKKLGNESVTRLNLKDFLSLQPDDIEKLKIVDNYYCIPKLKGLSDSFGALNNQDFINKIQSLRDHFDFVVVDTAPMLSIADTGIMLSMADVKLMVVRHGQTKMNEIKQTIHLVGQLGVTFDGVIYNFYSKPSSYYGYYGLYGDYNYQYYAERYLNENYDYEKNN